MSQDIPAKQAEYFSRLAKIRTTKHGGALISSKRMIDKEQHDR